MSCFAPNSAKNARITPINRGSPGQNLIPITFGAGQTSPDYVRGGVLADRQYRDVHRLCLIGLLLVASEKFDGKRVIGSSALELFIKGKK